MDSNINQLFNQTIDKMKSMVDVSVVVGKLMNFNGISVMPISRVRCGFISGGVNQKKEEINDDPFGGAAGGTMSLTPIAFLVILPNDTNKLKYGTYVYDLCFKSGDLTKTLCLGQITLTNEATFVGNE